jgi:hypothetical protein
MGVAALSAIAKPFRLLGMLRSTNTKGIVLFPISEEGIFFSPEACLNIVLLVLGDVLEPLM